MDDNTIDLYKSIITDLSLQTEELEKDIHNQVEIPADRKIKFLNLQATITKLQTEISEHAKKMVGDDTKFEILDKMSYQILLLSKRVDDLRKKLSISTQLKVTNKINLAFQTVNNALNAVENFFSSKVRGFIFSGAANNRMYKALPSQITKEKKRLMDCEEQKKATTLQKGKLQNELDLSSEDLLNTKLIKLKILALEKKEQFLINKIDSLTTKIEKNESKLEINNQYQIKNNLMRAHCKTLGGERIAIKTPDGLTLDGMYLDARKFRETLGAAQGEIVSLESKTGTPIKIQALAFSNENYEKSGKQIHEALRGLHALTEKELDPQEKVPGTGWTFIQDKGRVLFIRSEVFPGLMETNHPLFYFSFGREEWQMKEINASSFHEDVQPIDSISPATGSVILTSGAFATYEMLKTEAAYYLLKNMNVLLFNYRGYGYSEGTPTIDGLKIDMESAYQLLKEKSKHEDKQILLKALCISGGPAAYVAAKHPECNIFLDQSYSSFKKLIGDIAGTFVERYFNALQIESEKGTFKDMVIDLLKDSLKSIVAKVASFATPDLNTAKALAANQGHKAIFFIQDDDVINTRHVEKNMKAITEAGHSDYLTVLVAPGEHGDDILYIEKYDYEFLESAEIRQMKRKEEQLLEEADELYLTEPRKAQILRAEAIKLSLQRSDLQEELFDQIGIDMPSEIEMPSKVIYKQVDYFLAKAGLSNEIIKTTEELNILPAHPLITNANEFINIIEHLKPLNKFAEIALGKEMEMHMHEEDFIFSANLGNKKNKIIMNSKEIQELVNIDYASLLEKCQDLMKKDLLEISFADKTSDMLINLDLVAKKIKEVCQKQFDEKLLGSNFRIKEIQSIQFENRLLASIDELEQGLETYKSDCMTPKHKQDLESSITKTKLLYGQLDEKIIALGMFINDISDQVFLNPLLDLPAKKHRIQMYTNRLNVIIEMFSTQQQLCKDTIAASENALTIGSRIKELKLSFELWKTESRNIADRADKLSVELPLDYEIYILSDATYINRDQMNERFKELIQENRKIQKRMVETSKQKTSTLQKIERDNSLNADGKRILKQIVEKDYAKLQQELVKILDDSKPLFREWLSTFPEKNRGQLAA